MYAIRSYYGNQSVAVHGVSKGRVQDRLPPDRPEDPGGKRLHEATEPLPVAVPLTVAAGPVGLRVARDRAERRFVAALPGGVEQVATAVRGGASVAEAVGALAA